MTRRPVFWLVASGIVAVIAYAAFKPAHQPDAGGADGERPAQVSTVLSEAADVPLQVDTQGTVSAINSVELRPLVSSTVKAVHVREGQEVKKGQLLFTLDGRADSAKVAQTAAELAQQQAQQADAERNLQRQRELLRQGFVAQSALDTAQTTLDSSRAVVAAKAAELEANRVGLAYQTLRAPFSGRIGAIDVHPGSLVQASMASPLLTLSQIDPIAVAFTLPEAELSRLLAVQAQGSARAVATLADGSRIEGKLSFIDNAVNSESGTVKLKAEFANAKRQLWPGAFVRVQLDLGIDPQAVVLPSSAVQTGPKGQFVYLVQADSSVAVQPVTLRRVISRAGKQFAVVAGLAGGARVVAEGGQNLRPGAKVAEARAAGQPAK